MSYYSLKKLIKKTTDALQKEKTFKNLFQVICSFENNIFCEDSDSYFKKETTYKEQKELTIKCAYFLSNNVLSNIQPNTYIGLSMQNSRYFFMVMWSLLYLGYKPVLLNTNFDNKKIEEIVILGDLKYIISDKDLNIFNTCNILSYIKDILELDNPNIKENFEDEIVFLTSGTSGDIKLCFYNGNSIINEINNTKYICDKNKNIIYHYKGKLKLLCLLPFYHIFGLIANYFWFCTFGRTLVFIKNPSKDNLFITIQKHKVTHLFFVPLFFNFIVKGILSEVKKDPIKLKKFNKALKFSLFLQRILPNIGRRFARIMFKDIYKSTFGNSLRFLISGGSDAKKETLEILNGIGFILVNGYGSSEVGITSLVLSKNIKQRITPNIGKPLLNAMYSISPDNTLIINSSSMCYLIKSSEHKTTKLTSSSYYDTLDLTKKDKYGNYIITGRADDLVILENGNNINLNQVAANITINTVDNYILLNINSKLSLVLESKNINISNYKNVFEEISNLNLQSEGISSIYFTNSLLENGTIKMSRKKILNDISLGNIKLVKYTDFFNTFENDENNKNLIIVEDIKTILAGFLDIDINEINLNSNIIYDLGASSLEYYSVIQTINNKYMVQLNIDKICMNVSDIVKDIVSKKEI